MLFTDLVGSTALRQAVGDDAADELRRSHDRVLRDAVAAHGGHEVKGTGDGLMIVFDSAVEAVAAAEAMQRGVERLTRRAPAPILAGHMHRIPTLLGRMVMRRPGADA